MQSSHLGHLGRIVRHLVTPHLLVRRAFPSDALKAITEEIRRGETAHRGEIRFAVEASLDLGRLFRGQTARERARELFSVLGIWDTEENNGVLIYLLFADRDVEIVADRGIHARVGTETWERICRRMEAAFREGHFTVGVIEGIRAISEILAREFPATGPNPNEQPDEPVLLR